MSPDRRAILALRLIGSLSLLAAGLALAWLSLGILERDRGFEADPLLGAWGAYALTVWIFARVSWGAMR